MAKASSMTDTDIPVVAIREGYYGSEIKPEGKKFNVATEQELGSWMARLDGKKNWAENRHLVAQEAVATKTFTKLDADKLESETKLKNKAEKEVASAHADAKPLAEIQTPAQKAAATRAKNKANAAPKKAAGNTKGLI